MKAALEGIRVLDLTHVLAGPTATMILADLGADVIHIEPPQGDDAREFGPFVNTVGKNNSGYFVGLNRGKKSMVLNLKNPKAVQILRDLCQVADIIIENYRPGTMKALGFSWEEIQRLNPRLIYASISGFGHQTLPEYASRPAYDIISQAYSGLMSLTGPEHGSPCRVGASMGDIMSGHQAVIGIMAALYYRSLTGKGQWYDGSMVDGLFSSLENAVVRYTSGGEIPAAIGTAHPAVTPFQAFPTRDKWIVVAIGNDKLWVRFCTTLERKDLIEDSRFRTNPARTTNREALAAILGEELAKKPYQEWEKLFDADGIPFSPVNDMKQICEDPHIQCREMLVEIEQKGIGKMNIAGSPIRLSETPGRVYGGAPVLGEHTEEILTSILKMSQPEILALRKEGAIN
jgi:CoA:oxalate CoA-transferase